MEITTDESRQRFEIVTDGKRSVLDYELQGDSIVFTHTGVPRELEGKGFGSALAKAGLEFARQRNLRVIPACSFIAAYLRRHPEYQDLVAKR